MSSSDALPGFPRSRRRWTAHDQDGNHSERGVTSTAAHGRFAALRETARITERRRSRDG